MCVQIYCCFGSMSCTSFKHFSQWLSLSFELEADKQLIKNWSGVEQKVVLPAYVQEQYSCQKHQFKLAHYIPTVGDILISNSVCGPGNKPGVSVWKMCDPFSESSRSTSMPSDVCCRSSSWPWFWVHQPLSMCHLLEALPVSSLQHWLPSLKISREAYL